MKIPCKVLSSDKKKHYWFWLERIILNSASTSCYSIINNFANTIMLQLGHFQTFFEAYQGGFYNFITFRKCLVFILARSNLRRLLIPKSFGKKPINYINLFLFLFLCFQRKRIADISKLTKCPAIAPTAQGIGQT